MIKIIRTIFVSVNLYLALLGYIKVSNASAYNDASLEVISLIAFANAEGTSCTATCEGCDDITVSDCQYCSSKTNEYVKCWDSEDNLIDEKYCSPCT